MVTHAKEFRLLADVEMVPQILLVRGFIQTVDKILKQFTGTIGCNLVANLYSGFTKKFSAMIRGMEHKGKIIQPEGFLIIVSVHQVIILALLHGQDHHIIGDKGKEYLSIRFAYPLRFLDAPQPVSFLVQMIQRSKEQNNIERTTFIPAQIQRIALNQVDGIIFSHLCPEGCYVCICKFQRGHTVSLSGKVKAILPCTGAHIKDLCVGSQILLDIPNRCQKFNSSCIGLIQTAILIIAPIDLLHKFRIIRKNDSFGKVPGFLPFTSKN